jgi:hypothetical protein
MSNNTPYYASQYGCGVVGYTSIGSATDTSIFVAGKSAQGLTGQGITFTPGKWYGVSGQARILHEFLGPMGSRVGYIQGLANNQMSWSSLTTNVVSTSLPNTAGVYEQSIVFQVPSDSVWAAIRLFNGSSNPADIVYWDKLFIVEGDSEEEVRYKLANGFFDGNSTNTPANTVKYWDDTEKAWIPSQTNKAQETADKAIAAAAEAFSAANLVQAAMNGLISTGYTQPVDPVKGSLWFQQRTDDDAIIGI